MIDLVQSNPTAGGSDGGALRKKRASVFNAGDGCARVDFGREKKLAVQKWMKGVAELAEKESFEPLPELTDELYAVFAKTGDRLTVRDALFRAPPPARARGDGGAAGRCVNATEISARADRG